MTSPAENSRGRDALKGHVTLPRAQSAHPRPLAASCVPMAGALSLCPHGCVTS